MDHNDWMEGVDPQEPDAIGIPDFESLSRQLQEELSAAAAEEASLPVPEETAGAPESSEAAEEAAPAPAPRAASWLDQLLAFADRQQEESAHTAPSLSREEGNYPIQQPANLPPEAEAPQIAEEAPSLSEESEELPLPEESLSAVLAEEPDEAALEEEPTEELLQDIPQDIQEAASHEVPEEIRIPVTHAPQTETEEAEEEAPADPPEEAPKEEPLPQETPQILAYPFTDLNYPVQTPTAPIEPEPEDSGEPAPFDDWNAVFSVQDEDPQPEPDAPEEAAVEPEEQPPQAEEPEESPSPETAEAPMEAPAPTEEAPLPAEEPPKEEGDFRIETDYRQDFGEYDRIHPIQLDRHHRTGCLGGILYFLFILVCGCLLGAVLWLAAVDVLAINKPAREVEITIPDDFTVDEVTDILYDQGLINYKPLFRFFANFAHAEEKIEPGVYQLKTSYDYRALVSSMSSYSGYRVETEVTIPEGYNLFQTFAKLEEEGVCTQEKLWEAAQNGEFDYDFLEDAPVGDRYRLEGYLFPDTYKFYVNDDPERVLNKMLRNFDVKLTPEYRERAAELGFSLRQIITVASMIEKETGQDSERATIASVIYNRLASEEFPNLQIDATFQYAALVENTEPSSDIDSPYNTYVVEGLPAGPITNPGITSIKAALYPETTNYTYYAATVDFTTRFFTNYNDFMKFVESDEFQRSGG